MDQRQIQALSFLSGILPKTAALENGGLESLSASGAETEIAPAGYVPDDLKPLVQKTVEKIAARRPLEAAETFALEAIIIPDKRPVLDVLAGNTFATDHPLWKHLLDDAPRNIIRQAIPAVGRVELPGHPALPYGGTAFVAGPGLIMTNRHVAEIFANGLGLRDLAFKPGLKSDIDLEKRVDGGTVRLEVVQVVMIHPYWDMALLRVEDLPDTIAPLRLEVTPPSGVFDVVAIGYPAFDPRNDAQVQNQVFRGIYNVKRLMPGKFTGRRETNSFGKTVNAGTHDPSTLGGASGSAVLSVGQGTVAALHFGGLYLDTNFGVPAFELARDGRVIDAGVAFAGTPQRQPGPWDDYWADTETPAQSRVYPSPAPQREPTANRVSVTIPVTVTVDIGSPGSAPVTATATARPPLGPPDNLVPVEAPAEDYRTRRGYVPEFLGPEVPLPKVGATHDILSYDNGGLPDTELRYEHFSVVMSRSRRMCILSACNIDGGRSRKAPRVGWRLDPRIPSAQQILNECYGNPPRFSRGHMTRREDPVWGDDAATWNRGNADSMHVTNTVPQMQAFNSPIWLALEDYALGHAREDAMKISVFTGPYFDSQDPPIYGIRIPVKFWKVIAFIHDRTGKLCATGYEMSQKDSLPSPDTEFVFGEFHSPQQAIATQTSIRAIEARGGISFGGLADVDAKSSTTEASWGGTDIRLDQLEQIRFL
ncbi:DNA/RNA non-specific endonuclease [Asticcacaulis benevestitus]|uniref:Serine protease n=1 Tax=Asticcacaulis benevestitus DSM 16100 = ATCC BAA-896 TaxID=1121022 RepID=V4PYW8_9CAUL|nr:DNA/RNA non-specific endonuclease [Asticcacaulis benevestitus]ESQ92604.1 hypothetical protein ABENE_08175 [Asticcacaulis benevestitus DSM 16100 = ATCC BAA-896]